MRKADENDLSERRSVGQRRWELQMQLSVRELGPKLTEYTLDLAWSTAEAETGDSQVRIL